MVDKQATLPGQISIKVGVTAATACLALGQPGSGSNSGGQQDEDTRGTLEGYRLRKRIDARYP
ncbi:hypothetical protein [Rhizobium rhizogenes]|uniref:hypothetical protein n=1 Tax=Rhizobium rhizogenes TaxID=359 RepID=UPI00164EF23E